MTLDRGMGRVGRPARVMLAAAALLCGCELASILWITGGHVLYSQDDPYIHLALARRLVQSLHYGINPGEAASPASSILYPFLLVIGLKLGLGAASALLICLVATAVSGVLVLFILRDAGYALDVLPVWALAGIAVIVLAGFNLIGAAFTGLEHALHIALTLASLWGLQRFLKAGRIDGWWLPCAFLCPLVRYEGVAVWLTVAAVLAWHGRWRAGLLLLAADALALGGFSAWLMARGLPPLPSSVLAKAGGASMIGAGMGSGATAHILSHIRDNLLAPGFKIVGTAVVLCTAGAVIARRNGNRVGLWIGCVGVLLCTGQMVVGTFGNVGRYEAYAIAAGFCCAAVALAEPGGRWLLQASPGRIGIGLSVAALALNNNIGLAVQTPLAARNIYDQPYQLHRFQANFWHGPIGVNDIGEVSYGTSDYVLDFAGLASEEARLNRSGAAGPAWMDTLARRHNVGLVMIFPDWFPALPPSWVPVAALDLTGPDLVTGGPRVMFYAVTPAAAAAIRGLLPAFAATLPDHTKLFLR